MPLESSRMSDSEPNDPPVVRAATDEPKRHTSQALFWAIACVGLCIYISLFFLGDRSWRFAIIGLQLLPFLLLSILAYLGDRSADAATSRVLLLVASDYGSRRGYRLALACRGHEAG